jgi:hypothetical protein
MLPGISAGRVDAWASFIHQGPVPYRRWLRLVILDLSCTIAVRTVVTVTDPTTAIATWANLHC